MRGISTAAGTVNQTCVFIGSDLDGLIGSDLDGNASQTASCWDPIGGDAGNSTSMSSGSGDGEAKSEVEASMLCRRLHGVEGFGSTG